MHWNTTQIQVWKPKNILSNKAIILYNRHLIRHQFGCQYISWYIGSPQLLRPIKSVPQPMPFFVKLFSITFIHHSQLSTQSTVFLYSNIYFLSLFRISNPIVESKYNDVIHWMNIIWILICINGDVVFWNSELPFLRNSILFPTYMYMFFI